MGLGKLTSNSPHTLGAARFFQEKGFFEMKSFLSEPILTIAYDYTKRQVALGYVEFDDTQVPNTPSAYGDAFMETNLDLMCGVIEQAINLRLYPTYSYYRVYKSGDTLAPHRDRSACEISVTLTLGYKSDVM